MKEGEFDGEFTPTTAGFVANGPGYYGDYALTLTGPMPRKSIAIVRRLARERSMNPADVFLCALDVAILSMLGNDACPVVRKGVLDDACRWGDKQGI